MQDFQSSPRHRNEGCSYTSSTCVVYPDSDLECLGICQGTNITDVVKNLAKQILAIKSILNLTDLDLKCLASCSPDPCPTEYKLTNILQLLITNTCNLITTG